jgi:hypothetical protein
VAAHFGDETVTLELGAAGEGGRFARLKGDPEVFIAPARLWDQLEHPLASRTALAVPLEEIRSVELSSGERSAKVSGDGKSFQSETLDADASAALAEAVATLRASAVTGYGAAAATDGLAAPHARVVVGYERDGAAGTREILIGAPSEGQGGRHARRADLDAGFVLPSEQVEALLATLD